jgi:hypothetical protein
MPALQLSDGQTLAVHGIFPRSRVLTWADVEARRFAFRWLVDTLRVPPAQLRALQPDAARWAAAGLVTAADCADMAAWPLDPLLHLGLQAVNLIGFPAAQLRAFGVRVGAMRERGLSGALMPLFHFSLAEWCALGATGEDIAALCSDAQCRLCFGTPLLETMAACAGHAGCI